MRFADPSYFYLLWTLIPLIFFLIWANRKKYDLIVRFCGANLFSKLVTLNFKELQKSKAIFVILTFLFLFIALTRPQWGYQWEDYKQEGVDIIIALDVSRSMLAKDIKPNRLERAKRKISDLLNMLKGDRIGLVAFAGTSFVQCPLTLDYAAARIFLNAIDTDLIPVQGTAIGDALRKSTNAFRTQENKSRAIILITDGEDQTGQAMVGAEVAKKAGCNKTQLIDFKKELPVKEIVECDTIGLTSGASAPEKLVQDFITEIKKHAKVSIDEYIISKESVTFKLPSLLAN